jgi:hypothetical protein
MTSREHARRLMLILLASEGTALRTAADDRMSGARERTRQVRGTGDGTQVTGDTDVSGLSQMLHRFGGLPLGPAER